MSVETSVTDAVVTWKFGHDGGLELTALKLQYKKGSQSNWQEIQIKPPNKIKYTIMDLEPNTNYKFRILATNSLGTSPPSSIYLAKTTKSGKLAFCNTCLEVTLNFSRISPTFFKSKSILNFLESAVYSLPIKTYLVFDYLSKYYF